MDCRRIQSRIPEYLSQCLSDSETAALSAHLAQCESCRGELEIHRQLDILIEETDGKFTPPDLTAEIMTRITEEIQPITVVRKKTAAGRGKRIISLAGDLLAAAAAAMLILWFSGPALTLGNNPVYSEQVVKFSSSIGSAFQSYIHFSASAVSKFSLTIKYADQINMKGDVQE